MLRKVYLYGRLARKFGSSFELDFANAGEAIRGLTRQIPGLEKELRKGQYRITAGVDLDLTLDEIDLGLGSRNDLHITPMAKAAGIGAILIGGIALISTALVVSSFLLRPQAPSPEDIEAGAQSFLFSGPTNSSEQGHPVPLIYGQVRTGSVVVSAGITTSDINQFDMSGDIGTTDGFIGSGLGSGGGRGWTIAQQSFAALKGGKSAGSTRTAKEDPNTLISQATARIVDLVGEGEIVGLVDGLRSVFLDETPVENEDGSYNFSGVSVAERVGLPDQDYIPGFSLLENTVQVGVEATFGNPVTRRITNPEIDVARVTLGIPRIHRQDTENGDLLRTEVTIAIELQSNNGGYTEIVRDTIRGKNTGPYQRDYDIRLPEGEAPHDIRLVRISPDSELASLENETHFDLYTEVTEAKLIYSDSAVYGLTIDARQFGTNVPDRAYEVRGLIIQVPSNYDPVTRTYTGIWNGTFKRAWTDNPAWVFYDLATNPRYGTGSRIKAENIDKYALYEISKYNDELVNDGAGGLEPRYTINTAITTATEAYNLFASIASNFRGLSYWGSGVVTVTQDSPEDPTFLVNRTNAVDGEFNYQKLTTFESRRSVAIVYWNDPEDNYRLTPEVVEDPELIRRLGWRPGTDTTAFGVTRRGQAQRLARWTLDDEANSSTAVDYGAGDDHSFVGVGRVISVEDPRFSGVRRGGRIRSASAAQITIDSPVTLIAGQVYTLSVMLPDGSASSRPVTRNAGEWSTLTLGGPNWTNVPQAGAVWSLESNLVANRQFRVRSASLDGPPYAIRGILHDPTKYERVESQVDLTTPNFFDLPSGPLSPPGNISVLEYLVNDGDAVSPAIQFSWVDPRDPRIAFYQSQYRRPLGDFEDLPDSSTLTREVRNSESGTWTFRVRSVDAFGRYTAWKTYSEFLNGQAQTLPELSPSIATSDDALQSVLTWESVNDVRPIRSEVLFGLTDNLGEATSLGKTDALEFPISQVGFYWVRSTFMGAVSPSPTPVEVELSDLPSVDYDNVSGTPQSLADVDEDANTKLSGVEDGATNNIGDLADLNSVTLGGPFVVGTLPVAKAVPELINENVPSVQNLRPFGNVTITGSSFRRNGGPFSDSVGVQHFERMNGGWKISARISSFGTRIRLFGYHDFVPVGNTAGLSLPSHQVFYTGAGTLSIVGANFTEANHSGIQVGDIISLEYTGTQYIARLNGEIIANPRKGLGVTPPENQKLIPTITTVTNGGTVGDISVESTGNNSFSAIEGEGSPVPFASSNTFLTANHPHVILDTNRWTLSIQGTNKGIATTQSNDGTFFEFRPSSARGTVYASLSDVVANSRDDLGRLYLRFNASGNGTTFLAANVWADGVLKPFHGPIIKTTDRVGLGYDGANYFVTVNRAKVFEYAAPPSLSLAGYLFTSHPADVNTWIFEDITWDTYNNASFESLGGAGLSRGQIETAGGISLGFFGQDYGATASEDEVANTRILIEPDGRLTGGGGGQVTLGGIGAGAVATLDVIDENHAVDELKNSFLASDIQAAATTAQYGSVTDAPQSLGDLDEDADSKLAGIQELADRTDTAIRTIIPQFPMIEVKQFEEGNQGNRLITHFIRRGGVTISGGAWSLGNRLLGAGNVSINSSNGLVTLSNINQSGSYEVIYTHTDTIQTRLIINVTYVAAPVSSGGGGGGGSNPPETVLSISNTPSVVDWFQGTTNTVSVSHTAREDGIALSGGTWSIPSSSGGSVTINTNGVATVTNVNGPGFYTVRYTLSGGARTVNKSINIQFYPNGPGSPNQFE